MVYRPKTAVEDRKELVKSCAISGDSYHCDDLLADLADCETCLHEALAEIERLKKREAKLIEAGDAMYTHGDFTRSAFNVDSEWPRVSSLETL